jgi:hypothetical protein
MLVTIRVELVERVPEQTAAIEGLRVAEEPARSGSI